MENINPLIENIKNCNLSEQDKNTLLEKLQNKPLNIDEFLKTLFSICKISKEILDFFDIGNN